MKICGFAAFSAGEVLVEAPLLDLALVIAVRLEILAELCEPVAGEIGREHAAHNGTAGAADRLTHSFRDLAIPDVLIVELWDDGTPRSHLSKNAVGGPADVILHVCVGAFQHVAVWSERPLERDDLVTNIHFYRSPSFILLFQTHDPRGLPSGAPTRTRQVA